MSKFQIAWRLTKIATLTAIALAFAYSVGYQMAGA